MRIHPLLTLAAAGFVGGIARGETNPLHFPGSDLRETGPHDDADFASVLTTVRF